MGVKIIMLRRVTPDKEEALRPLLISLRSLAMAQPGYVSGETLVNADDPETFLVISTWKSLENWDDWLGSEKRAEIQAKVDQLLGEETMYQIYYYS